MINPLNSKVSLSLLRIAAVLSLFALALFTWSVFDPRPPPILIGLTMGQVLGLTAFGMYLISVVADIRSRRRSGTSLPPPPPSKASKKEDAKSPSEPPVASPSE